jgi:7 transmembrane sweet-taste receptor of 3 GCPR
LGEYLVEAGEVRGVQVSDDDIKEEVLMYLNSQFSDSYYEPFIEGRLVNDTTTSDALLMGLRESCVAGRTYWSVETLGCSDCPSYSGVTFSKTSVVLEGSAFSSEHFFDHVVITNKESFSVELTPDTLGLPANLAVSIRTSGYRSTSNLTGNSFVLEPNEHLSMEINFDPKDRAAGRDTSRLVFSLSDLGRSADCGSYKIKFDVVAHLSLSSDMNYLGGVAAFGYTSAALIVMASVAFAAWVRVRRNKRVISTMQPIFLMSLCAGVLLMGSSLVPFSLDDGVIDERGCDIACMARPWLLSVGFVLCCAALFSKLLRINKLFNSAEFQRVEVRERDVILPSCILVIMILLLNLVWTLTEPLSWERVSLPGQEWNTFGKCSLGDGRVGAAMFGTIVAICAIGFIATGVQAFRARNISSEYSESTYIGIAVFGWAQLCLVGVPVLFLVDDDNVVAKYCLVVGFIFAVCMSMLLIVFVPIIIKPKYAPQLFVSFAGTSSSRRTGESDPNEPTSLQFPTSSGLRVAAGEASIPIEMYEHSNEIRGISDDAKAPQPDIIGLSSSLQSKSLESVSVSIRPADFSVQPEHSTAVRGDSKVDDENGDEADVQYTA